MAGSSSPTWAGLPRWSWEILGLTLGVGALLFGFIWLNHFVREQIRDRDRYTIAFEDIDCEPPTGMSRSDFLDEVQYLGGMPSQLSLLEEGVLERLAAAFAKHPRVEKVARVERCQPRQVKVQLVFRKVSGRR